MQYNTIECTTAQYGATLAQ